MISLRRLLPLRLCLVVLLGSLLVGVQALQASPLHHHGSHAAMDCSIGHLPSLDAPQLQLPDPVARLALRLPCLEEPEQHVSQRRVTPYQGRAPPLQSR